MVQCMVVCSEVHGEMYGGVHDITSVQVEVTAMQQAGRHRNGIH